MNSIAEVVDSSKSEVARGSRGSRLITGRTGNPLDTKLAIHIKRGAAANAQQYKPFARGATLSAVDNRYVSRGMLAAANSIIVLI